jgi:thioredoxin 1
MAATHVDDKSFATEVLEPKGAVLIDFHAAWCGPCRAMGPVVDEIADELGERGKVVKANVDESPEAAAKYGVQSIPAFVVLKDGEVQEKFSGAVSKDRLLAAIEPHLN